MEKNIFKNVCICVTESLSCTAEINTTLCINYTSVKRMLKLKKKHYLIQLASYVIQGVGGTEQEENRISCVCCYVLPGTIQAKVMSQ